MSVGGMFFSSLLQIVTPIREGGLILCVGYKTIRDTSEGDTRATKRSWNHCSSLHYS